MIFNSGFKGLNISREAEIVSAYFYYSTMIIGLILETFQFIRLSIFEAVLFLYAGKKKVGTHKRNYLTIFYAPNSKVVLTTEEFSAELSVS